MCRLIKGFLMVLTATLLACAPVRMQIPRGLQGKQTSSLPVTYEQGLLADDKVSFGPWRTTAVSRDGISTERVTVAGLSSSEGSQPWRFVLTSPGGSTYKAKCLTTRKVAGFSFHGFAFGDENIMFACDIANSAGAVGQIAMGLKRRGQAGAVYWGKRMILIESEHRVAGSSAKMFTPMGYTFMDKGRIIAAAQVINDRHLWVAEGLDADGVAAVACALVARILVKDITPHDER